MFNCAKVRDVLSSIVPTAFCIKLLRSALTIGLFKKLQVTAAASSNVIMNGRERFLFDISDISSVCLDVRCWTARAGCDVCFIFSSLYQCPFPPLLSPRKTGKVW